MPHQLATNLPKIGGMFPAGAFAGVEAVLREALTNPSPYYRLLLAYRGFEGIKGIHRQFASFVKTHDLEAPRLEELKLDQTERAQQGFRAEALEFETLQQVIDYYRDLRDAAAHFFVGSRGSRTRQHLKFSVRSPTRTEG
jgi:hypothetical protein